MFGNNLKIDFRHASSPALANPRLKSHMRLFCVCFFYITLKCVLDQTSSQTADLLRSPHVVHALTRAISNHFSESRFSTQNPEAGESVVVVVVAVVVSTPHSWLTSSLLPLLHRADQLFFQNEATLNVTCVHIQHCAWLVPQQYTWQV